MSASEYHFTCWCNGTGHTHTEASPGVFICDDKDCPCYYAPNSSYAMTHDEDEE